MRISAAPACVSMTAILAATPALGQEASGKDARSGTVILGSVRVEADAINDGTSDPAATEGSGSYTTKSMNTATKLPLSIRETPQAVTVITRQRLDDQVMTSITDVVKYAPGLFLSGSDGPGRPSFSARGFNIDTIMYDGIPSRYQGWVVGSQANMAIFDRVEVVRGATGLVTGSGNPSAAINLVRKRPTRDLQLLAEGSAGSWDNYRGQVDLSGGLDKGGSLRLRAIGSWQDSGTFRDGEVIRRGLAHVIGEYDLTPDTVLMAGYTYQDDFYNSFWGGLPLSATGQHLGLPRSTRPSYDWEGKSQKSHTAFGEVAHRFDNGWSIRLAAMKVWQDAVFSGTYIYRNTDLSLTHSAYQASYDEDQGGADLYASGPVTLLGRDHDVTLGASYRDTFTRTVNYSGGGLQSGTIDIWAFDPASRARPNFVATTVAENIVIQRSLYASTRLNPADALKIILGGRLDWYKYGNRSASTGSYSVDAHKTLYGGVIYDFDRHHSVYASFTDIFQPQSARGFAADIASQSIIKPITGQNFEIGLKGEYLDGALNAAVALFQVDQKDRAFVPADQTGCPSYINGSGTQCSIAAGLVRSKGVDFEVQGAITPGWNVSLGYTYTSIKYVRDAANAGKPFEPRYPQHMAKLSTFYTVPGWDDGLRIGGGVTWQSRVYYVNDGTNFNNIAFRVDQAPYAVVDLMLGYKVSDRLDLQFNVNNVFDKSYYRAIGYDIRWGSTDAYGDPRNVLMTLRGKF
ncbi:MAG: TonB-dependent siderophore receptor [Sphingobium sp.]